MSGHGFAALASCVLFWVACSSAGERADEARRAVETALARGDREAALGAVEDLRAALPETPEAQLEVAQRLVESGSAPDAAWLLEQGVRRYPDANDLRLALAGVSLQIGNPSRVLELVAPIGEGSESHGAALVARAQAELDLGDLERALSTLAEAERLHPDEPEARLVRIATLLAEKRDDEARAAIEQARGALDSDTEQGRALRRRLDAALAQIQAQQGDPDAAIATLEGILSVDADDTLAWRALVQVLVAQNRAEEALARLAPRLAADPPPVDLLPIAAAVHAALGRDVDAEAALRRFVALSESPAAYLPLVEWHSARDDARTTTAVLDEAIGRFPEDATLRRLRSEALLADGRLPDARAEVSRFRAATFDDDPQVDYLHARLELADGRASEAAERLTELAPRLDLAATHYWLARALEQTGDTQGARRRYRLAQQRDPGWTAPAAALIRLERERGDWQAMAAAARLLLQRAPRQIEGWLALVDGLALLGDGAAAEEVARQCVALFPDRSEPRALLARALRAQGRTDEALAALAEAETRSGTASALAAERVLSLGMGGRIDAGIELAREALARDPDAAELHAALASLLFATGAAQEGARATDRALALAPDEPHPLRVRCEFRAASGDFSGARSDCARYLERRPDDAGAHFILGVALESLGERQRAADTYRRASALDEQDPRPRNNLAELLAAEGDLDGALAAAQEAYRLDATNPHVMDTLGALYLRKGLAARAVSLLADAHAGAPELADTALHLAMAYAETGRGDDARALLEDLLATRAATDPSLRARVDEALRALP